MNEYFVSYYFWKNGKTGIGNTFASATELTKETIIQWGKEITFQEDYLSPIVIMNIVRLEG